MLGRKCIRIWRSAGEAEYVLPVLESRRRIVRTGTDVGLWASSRYSRWDQVGLAQISSIPVHMAMISAV